MSRVNQRLMKSLGNAVGYVIQETPRRGKVVAIEGKHDLRAIISETRVVFEIDGYLHTVRIGVVYFTVILAHANRHRPLLGVVIAEEFSHEGVGLKLTEKLFSDVGRVITLTLFLFLVERKRERRRG